jgi:hypothetical protein
VFAAAAAYSSSCGQEAQSSLKLNGLMLGARDGEQAAAAAEAASAVEHVAESNGQAAAVHAADVDVANAILQATAAIVAARDAVAAAAAQAAAAGAAPNAKQQLEQQVEQQQQWHEMLDQLHRINCLDDYLDDHRDHCLRLMAKIERQRELVRQQQQWWRQQQQRLEQQQQQPQQAEQQEEQEEQQREDRRQHLLLLLEAVPPVCTTGQCGVCNQCLNLHMSLLVQQLQLIELAIFHDMQTLLAHGA